MAGEEVTYISVSGMLALLLMLAALAIPVLSRVLRKEGWVRHRRTVGVLAFVFALSHFLLVSHFFLKWDTDGMMGSLLSVQGAALLILFLLAATSNDTSMRLLKGKWKLLHYSLYVALALVLMHSLSRGMLFMKNELVAGAVLLLVVLLIVGKLKYQYPFFLGVSKPKP